MGTLILLAIWFVAVIAIFERTSAARTRYVTALGVRPQRSFAWTRDALLHRKSEDRDIESLRWRALWLTRLAPILAIAAFVPASWAAPVLLGILPGAAQGWRADLLVLTLGAASAFTFGLRQHGNVRRILIIAGTLLVVVGVVRYLGWW